MLAGPYRNKEENITLHSLMSSCTNNRLDDSKIRVVREMAQYDDKLSAETYKQQNVENKTFPEEVPPCMENIAKRYVIIIPGKMKKDIITNKLAKAFDMHIDQLNKVFPPGDVSIVKSVNLKLNLEKDDL